MIKLGFNVKMHENLVESVYESMLAPQHSDMNFGIFNNMPYVQSMLWLGNTDLIAATIEGAWSVIIVIGCFLPIDDKKV